MKKNRNICVLPKSVDLCVSKNRTHFGKKYVRRICSCCGREFIQIRRRGSSLKYCSDDCRLKARKLQNRRKSKKYYDTHIKK